VADKFLSDSSIKAGSTSVSVIVQLIDRTTFLPKTGIAHTDLVSASYLRQGGVRTAIALSALAAVDSAYSSGGWKELDSTNMPGYYRLDLPDAAVATGADWVHIDVADDVVFTQTTNGYALVTYANLADAVLDEVCESAGSYTLRQIASVVLAVLAGRTSNGGLTFKTPDNSATRVAATTNSSKERTAITITP
jgi:hypothetical protein